MTFEERLKLVLGEQIWTAATLLQRLEEAQARIAELEKPKVNEVPESKDG